MRCLKKTVYSPSCTSSAGVSVFTISGEVEAPEVRGVFVLAGGSTGLAASTSEFAVSGAASGSVGALASAFAGVALLFVAVCAGSPKASRLFV